MSTMERQSTGRWRDAFAMQMDLWRWLRTQDGKAWMLHHLIDNSSGLQKSTRELISMVYNAEIPKLEGADPVYVSSEMCEVIDAARHGFEPEPLLRTDLLTEAGFVYFARPFDVVDRFDRPVTIKGFSWLPLITTKTGVPESAMGEGKYGPGSATVDDVLANTAIEKWRGGEGYTGDGIALTIYADREREYELALEHHADLRNVDRDSRLARRPMPTMLPMHLTPWWFGMSFEGNEVDENGVKTNAEWWWRVVQSTLRLMQQRIAVRHHVRPDRPQRREAKRLEFHDRDVQVDQAAPGARRQPGRAGRRGELQPPLDRERLLEVAFYPSLDGHRQIWINSFANGDATLPLVIKPRRAYTWDR